MKHHDKRSGISRAATVLVGAWLCAPAWALAAHGGVIQFVGAVVSPPFSVTAPASQMQTSALTTTSTGVESRDASAVSVKYVVEANSSPMADVSVETVGAANPEAPAVTARFADDAGHTVEPDRNGEYRLIGSGGVLTLAPRNDRSSAAVVVTRYQ
ncbi:MAG TPA: hypothetical protein VL689_07255 [Paraburkholderia sp.]|jgi:hypothetical protein|nr:hypothetical protein [Paraburkholderia sp.]